MNWGSFRTRLILLNSLILSFVLIGLGFAISMTSRTLMYSGIERDTLQMAERALRTVPPDALETPRNGPLPNNQFRLQPERQPQESPEGQPPTKIQFQLQPNQPKGQNAPTNPGQFGPGPGGPNLPPVNGPRYEPPWMHPVFFTPEGEPLGRFEQLAPYDPAAVRTATEKPFFRDRIINNVHVLLVYIRGQRGDVRFVVQHGHELNSYDQLVASQNKLMLILIPLSLVLAVSAGWFMSDRALKPVDELTQAAARISEQSLSTRLEVRGNDEIARLAQTFNDMIARLEISFEKRERLYKDLQIAFERQRQFVGDASHELRTPLTRIKVSTGIALGENTSLDEAVAALKLVDNAAGEMSQLIHELLLLARSDGGTLPVAPESVSVASIAQKAICDTASLGGPTPAMEIEPNLSVWMTQEHLRRVLVNLLENARRHTPVDGQIHLLGNLVGERAIVKVSDTGCGVPQDALPYIAERFFRVDESRHRGTGGAGLGLAICKSLVEAAQGTMRFESQRGKGMTVILELPTKNTKIS